MNSIAERYCAACGADLARAVDDASARIDAILQQATLLESDGELLAAIECLSAAPTYEHSVLAKRVADVTRLREELVGKRESIVANLQERMLEAERLMNDRRFAQAREQLLRIPVSIRNQRARSLLEELETLLREIAALRAQVRQALKQGVASDALSDVERLHELEPHADDVRRLWRQLSDARREQEAALAKKLIKRARDAVAANNYLTAGSCLRKIPASALENVRELYDAVRERVWLARQIMTARYADPTLLAIAARLVKLQPRDEVAAEWLGKIKQRLARAEVRSGYPMVPWTKSSGRPRLGVSAEPITNAAKVHWDSSDPNVASWQQGLRRHLVALGLALIGLGRGRYDFDLRPSRSSSWLERLSRVGNLRRPTAAWGLDFGSSGLKVLRLSVNKEGIVAADASGIIAYDRQSASTEAPDAQPYLDAALAAFVEQFAPGDEPLVVSFPGAQSLGRFFLLPHVGQEKKFRTLIEYEIREQIPIPVEEVVFAADRMKCEAEDGADLEHDRVIVVAAKRSHLELRTGPFVGSNLGVYSLQSECVALLNVLHHCHADQLSDLQHDESIALVEVGDTAVNIVTASPRGSCFRTLHHGLRRLNTHVVKQLAITHQQADQLRQRWAHADVMCRVDDALLPAFDELTRAVHHALYACAETTGTRVILAYVAGGGCNQYGVLRSWSQSDESVADDRLAQT